MLDPAMLHRILSGVVRSPMICTGQIAGWEFAVVQWWFNNQNTKPNLGFNQHQYMAPS